MPGQLPAGLHHVLQVYRLVRRSRYDRLSAIKEVARHRRVDPQTIASACTRSLGINTEELEDLLHPHNAKRFREHVVRRFPSHQSDWTVASSRSVLSLFPGAVPLRFDPQGA